METKGVEAFKNAKELITGATSEPLSENQKRILIVCASVNPAGIIDIKTFCENRGIDATSVPGIGRCLYYSEEALIETWEKYEEKQEEIRQYPSLLAKLCAQIEKGLVANQSRGGRS